MPCSPKRSIWSTDRDHILLLPTNTRSFLANLPKRAPVQMDQHIRPIFLYRPSLKSRFQYFQDSFATPLLQRHSIESFRPFSWCLTYFFCFSPSLWPSGAGPGIIFRHCQLTLKLAYFNPFKRKSLLASNSRSDAQLLFSSIPYKYLYNFHLFLFKFIQVNSESIRVSAAMQICRPTKMVANYQPTEMAPCKAPCLSAIVSNQKKHNDQIAALIGAGFTPGTHNTTMKYLANFCICF